jgi:hypothetical protein
MLWSIDGWLDRLFCTRFYRKFEIRQTKSAKIPVRYSSFSATQRRRQDLLHATLLQYSTLLTNMLALLGGSFAHTIQTGLVSFMVSVRKVEASNSESSIDELFELRDVPACGAQRANNLALAFLGLGLGHDLFKRNVGAAEFRAGCGYFGVGEGHDS